MRSEKMKEEPILTIDAKYLGMKFDELIRNYPYLSKFLISSRPPKFDLGDPLTLSELNKCLFKELSELDIEVPFNHLIPAYSLRAAYAQAINELVKSDEPIIEIGTGASGAIALILAKKYGKRIIATEINAESYESAKKNIQQNKLEKKITLFKSNGEIIKGIIPKGDYAALVSYPPIYPSDLSKLKKQRGWKGVKTELIAGKNELDFAIQLVNESLNSKDVEIDFVTVQVMNKGQLFKLLNLFSDRKDCYFIEIIAGTRKRYILVVDNRYK